MAYEKNVWNTGDLISSEKMNHIETGIADIESNITAQAVAAVNGATISPNKIHAIDKLSLKDPESSYLSTIEAGTFYDSKSYTNHHALFFCADAFCFSQGWTKAEEETGTPVYDITTGEITSYIAPDASRQSTNGITLYDLEQLFKLIPYVNKLISLANSSSSGSGSGSGGTEEPPAEEPAVEVDPESGTGGNGGSEVEPIAVVEDPADPDDPGAEPAADVPTDPGTEPAAPAVEEPAAGNDPNAEDPDPNAEAPVEVEEPPANP